MTNYKNKIMQATLDNNYNQYSMGTAISGSIVFHIILLAALLIYAKQANLFDSSIQAMERSTISLNFTKPKPQPVIEKKPLEKFIKPISEKPVLKEQNIAEVSPITTWHEEPVIEEVKQETPVEEIVVSDNIQEVANDTVIKDASFKGNRTAPKYPKRAKMLGLEGTVVIKALIDIEGDIKDIQVLDSSGYTILDKAVTKVAWKWKFEPSYVNGRPAEQWVKAPYEFVIR